MQLDRTHVAIRLRTLSEIGDLAMIMIRRYPTALLIGFAAGFWSLYSHVSGLRNPPDDESEEEEER